MNNTLLRRAVGCHEQSFEVHRIMDKRQEVTNFLNSYLYQFFRGWCLGVKNETLKSGNSLPTLLRLLKFAIFVLKDELNKTFDFLFMSGHSL